MTDPTATALEHPAADRPADPKPTRKRLPFWDRVKFLILLAALWLFLMWAKLDEIPIMSVEDAARDTLRSKAWILVVAGLEVLRQVHYFVSERWSGWHRFWTDSVFGRIERRTGRLNDWNRYRIARAAKWVVFFALLSVVLGAILGESPLRALLRLPGVLWDAAPMFIQVIFIMLIAVGQFAAIFWFLSRGGVDVYFPDDIKTRFNDVWGQDPVLERVKENMLFLDAPETIEERGGHVPGGILLWGPPGTGKGQPVSGLVMTPSGPRRMGDLLPGDFVIGSDGGPTRVTEVHLLGERDLFEVTFSDGASLAVTEDHLWQVTSRYGGTKVRSTADLVDRLTEADGHSRYRIPMAAPAQFIERDLPLDPYLMGALLGDGTFRHQIAISSADIDVLARVEMLLPGGDGLVRKSEFDWSIVGGETRTALKELGLFGHYSYEKWIPEEFLWSSIDQRLRLLQGLMDTDGSVDQRGVVEYCTTSDRLAEDVRCLVRSFGGTCTMTTRVTRFGPEGDKRRGRPVHTIRMSLPADLAPVLLDRKAARLRPRTKYFPHRRIVSIEPAGREEARCIRVAATDHLYVADHFIVTHNTLMAEAVAGETGKPFVFVDPGAFINMFFGVGVLKVKGLFRKLRKLAVRYGGVIVFFDEADSLGSRGAVGGGFAPGGAGAGSALANPGCNGTSYLAPHTASLLFRSSLAASAAPPAPPPGLVSRFMYGAGMGGGGMGTLQALLTELSGLKKPRGFFNRVVRRTLGMRPKPPPRYRILVMMATNMPQALDEALLRPGRIDRIYRVGYPSKEGRKRTYEGYLAKVDHDLTADDIDKLATITPYATGATIKDLVNEALIVAIRDGRETITWKDVVKAKLLKSLGPPEDVEYIERERHATAVHEACHAVIAYRFRRHLAIDIATIEKGQTYLGMVSSIPLEEQFTQWRSEYDADLMVCLASLAGERLFFGDDSSSGVSGDLTQATALATYMEGYWGMGEQIGSQQFIKMTPQMVVADPSADMFETELGRRVETRLQEVYGYTRELLEVDRMVVLAVAHALETHKTLTGDDVEAVIEGREGPLVDGRPYHTPEFHEQLEAYHLVALDAHRLHGKVEIALPSLNGHGQLGLPLAAAEPSRAEPPVE